MSSPQKWFTPLTFSIAFFFFLMWNNLMTLLLINALFDIHYFLFILFITYFTVRLAWYDIAYTPLWVFFKKSYFWLFTQILKLVIFLSFPQSCIRRMHLRIDGVRISVVGAPIYCMKRIVNLFLKYLYTKATYLSSATQIMLNSLILQT